MNDNIRCMLQDNPEFSKNLNRFGFSSSAQNGVLFSRTFPDGIPVENQANT